VLGNPGEPNVLARTETGPYWVDWMGGWEIIINVNGNFFNLTPQQQAQTMFHEILHHMVERFHDPDVEQDAQMRTNWDPVYACAAVCFNDPLATKCSCATCFQTTECDARCKLMRDCGPRAICPCSKKPPGGTTYDTCADCSVACPVGLACAFTQCKCFGTVCPP